MAEQSGNRELESRNWDWVDIQSAEIHIIMDPGSADLKARPYGLTDKSMLRKEGEEGNDDIMAITTEEAEQLIAMGAKDSREKEKEMDRKARENRKY